MARAANNSSISLTAAERTQLERWARGRTTPQRLAWRSRIVLLAADGASVRRTAALVGVSARTVLLWRKRFLAQGITGLQADRTGRGRKPSIGPSVRHAIARAAGDGAAARTVAKEHGVSPTTVRRLWQSDRGAVTTSSNRRR